jgi:hypothetical protein
MKRLLTLSLGLIAQAFALAQRPVPVDLFVQDPDQPGYSAFAHVNYSINLRIKDGIGTALYGELQTGQLDATSHTSLQLGTGTVDPDVGIAYDQVNWVDGSLLNYFLTIHHPDGDRTIDGEYPIGRAPRSIIAECALNAKRIANYEWSSDAVETGVVFAPPDDVTFCIPIVRKRPLVDYIGRIEHLHASSIIQSETAPSAVDDTPVSYQRIGNGEEWPWSFGSGNLTEVENAYQVSYNGPMDKLYNMLGLKMKDYGTNLGRPAATLYAENIYDNMGVGIFANGRSRGVYSQGQTGVLGICNNQTGNGAAVWGWVAFDAGSANANYGGYFTSNNHAFSYSIRADGDMLLNGALMKMSDGRLKKEVQNISLGLPVLLALRPTTYQYIQQAPMTLPAGTQYGFIAEEVEAILPEIVRDIPYPVTMDPDNMTGSDMVSYKAINYEALIPLLTKAIQELNAKVDSQAAEIAALKNHLAGKK